MSKLEVSKKVCCLAQAFLKRNTTLSWVDWLRNCESSKNRRKHIADPVVYISGQICVDFPKLGTRKPSRIPKLMINSVDVHGLLHRWVPLYIETGATLGMSINGFTWPNFLLNFKVFLPRFSKSMGSQVEVLEIHRFTVSQGTRPNAAPEYINITWASWLGRFSALR